MVNGEAKKAMEDLLGELPAYCLYDDCYATVDDHEVSWCPAHEPVKMATMSQGCLAWFGAILLLFAGFGVAWVIQWL